MSEVLPGPNQQIDGVTIQGGSKAVVGTARDVYFGDVHYHERGDPQEKVQQATAACRNALYLTDPYIDRESIISTKGNRVKGTCEWITHNEAYQTWLDGNVPLLWICGGPGKGKTMMSVFLTEEIERSRPKTDSTLLAYFFCSHQDEKRNTGVSILRTLLYQVITSRPRLSKHALSYFETTERTNQTLSSLETLWAILRQIFEDPELGTMFCVIDGLDECEEESRKILLARFLDFLAPQTPTSPVTSFRLSIISRSMPGMQRSTMVRLDPDNNEEVASDVKRFISTRVDELSGIEGFNENLRTTIRDILLARAEGTFLWVGFAMHELLQQKTCSQLMEALESLPSGLPAIYSRMLLQIPSKERKISSKILQWVTIAVRPMHVQELADAVSLRPMTHHLNMDRAIRDAIALCGPLLYVENEMAHLVHQSVRDYLGRNEPDSNLILDSFRIEPEKAHLELARRCVDCLEKSDFQHTHMEFDVATSLKQSPLWLYASFNWHEHTRDSAGLAAELLRTPFFEKQSVIRQHWWKSWAEAEAIAEEPDSLPDLHMASYFGIIPWADAILTKKRRWRRTRTPVNDKASEWQTPLHWAAKGGSHAVVRLLLSYGADVHAETSGGYTALHWAALADKTAVVRLLIDHGANVHADTIRHNTILCFAANRRNEELVQLLLDKGVDVNASNHYGSTALLIAASTKHEAVVKLLVAAGADVNLRPARRKTALHWLASDGLASMVQLLLDHGADVHLLDSHGQTALHGAAAGGYHAVVQLLINAGAEINVASEDGRTALHLAAKGGYTAAVQLLISVGAEINTAAEDGSIPLSAAAQGGHMETVQLLVEAGKDDDDGETALYWATLHNQEPSVQLLIDCGVKITPEIVQLRRSIGLKEL